MKNAKLLLTAAFCLLTSLAHAEIKLTPIDYTHDGPPLQGFLAYDDAWTSPRPAVLVVPEWWGITDYPKSRAKQLAELGYVAFVADIYGKGISTDDPNRAGELATPFLSDRAKLRARATAALDTLKQQKQVDKQNLAAIGYCFGGTTVLELVRAGADLKAAIPFHALLTAPTPATKVNPDTKILVCHGADDPMVPMDQVTALVKEMKQAGANCQINVYPNAVHAFTNPAADKKNIPGVAYNKQADTRSWEALKSLLTEAFGPPH